MELITDPKYIAMIGELMQQTKAYLIQQLNELTHLSGPEKVQAFDNVIYSLLGFIAKTHMRNGQLTYPREAYEGIQLIFDQVTKELLSEMNDYTNLYLDK